MCYEAAAVRSNLGGVSILFKLFLHIFLHIIQTFQHYFKQIILSVPHVIDLIHVRVNFYSPRSLSNENIFHFGFFVNVI